MRKIALIPARAGSKRIKDKNMSILGGKPLLQYTLDLISEMDFFDSSFVSTDSERYASFVTSVSSSEVHMRPPEISQDHSTDLEWIQNLLETFNLETDTALFILRPTSPLRSKQFIQQAWSDFINAEKDYDSLRAVSPVDQHPAKMWSIINDDLLPLYPFSREAVPWHSNQSAVLPKVFKQTASLEIVWVKTIMNLNSLSGTRIMPCLCSGNNALDINSHEDLEYAEFLISRQRQKKSDAISI